MRRTHHEAAPAGETCPLIDVLGPGQDIAFRIDREKTHAVLPHQHPHGEFYLLRDGHIVSSSAQAQWLIPPGQAYWLPAGTPHGGALVRGSGICLYLSPRCASQLPDKPMALTASPLIIALIERWTEQPESNFAARPIDHHLAVVLADAMQRAAARQVLLRMPVHTRIRQAITEWSIQCDERVSLDELAVQCGMSRRHFTRIFRKETGMSAGEWRQIARLIHGSRLMAGGMSVTETAFALGYGSVTSFFNLCRKYTGLSPSSLARKE